MRAPTQFNTTTDLATAERWAVAASAKYCRHGSAPFMVLWNARTNIYTIAPESTWSEGSKSTRTRRAGGWMPQREQAWALANPAQVWDARAGSTRPMPEGWTPA
jgi:hypothetical protein